MAPLKVIQGSLVQLVWSTLRTAPELIATAGDLDRAQTIRPKFSSFLKVTRSHMSMDTKLSRSLATQIS